MKTRWLVVFCFLISSNAFSQAKRPDCSGAEYRQFDFWVGDWEVTDKDGNLQGHNTIKPLLNQCTLQENWQGATGSAGKSFNFYDRQSKQWHQTWIDNSGGVLYLDGQLEGDVMVLSGQRLGRDGAPVLHRIKYTPLDDGGVEQYWQASKDDGKTWQDLFLGYYKKQSDTGLM